jgi:hypothetical protein
MTAARQQRKPYRLRPTALVVLAALGAAVAPSARAGLTERIVVDRHTGLAIGGYDPVAYFAGGAAVMGRDKLELRYEGVVWRFGNIGNRDAFAAHPDVYMPQFGGYDPVGIARGVAVAGNPHLWIIVRERLFLFYDDSRRKTFAADPAPFIAAAKRKWPQVMSALDP